MAWNEREMKKSCLPLQVPDEALTDLQSVKQQLDELPPNKLLYIAGAVAALSAAPPDDTQKIERR